MKTLAPASCPEAGASVLVSPSLKGGDYFPVRNGGAGKSALLYKLQTGLSAQP